MLKKCKKCLIEQESENFNKGNDPKDGLKYFCKECQKKINKKYNDANKENYKIWSKANPDKIKEKTKRYYKKIKNNVVTDVDKIKIKAKRAKFYIKHKDKILKTVKDYSIKNSAKITKRYQEYKLTGKTKEYRDKTKHIIAWRNLLYNTLKRFGQKKEDKTITSLGYSATVLKNHITSLFTEGMTWDNYGEWHIDHIKTVFSFDKETPMNIVNALSNLRPLWSTTREINGVLYEGNLNRPKYTS